MANQAIISRITAVPATAIAPRGDCSRAASSAASSSGVSGSEPGAAVIHVPPTDLWASLANDLYGAWFPASPATATPWPGRSTIYSDAICHGWPAVRRHTVWLSIGTVTGSPLTLLVVSWPVD